MSDLDNNTIWVDDDLVAVSPSSLPVFGHISQWATHENVTADAYNRLLSREKRHALAYEIRAQALALMQLTTADPSSPREPPSLSHGFNSYNIYNMRDPNMISYDRIPKSPEEAACLEHRKWWAFLLSSVITFAVGICIVLAFRLFEFMCCGRHEVSNPGPKGSKQALQAARLQAQQLRRESQVQREAGGRCFFMQNLDWVTEAKDWAGALISGQSTTGRILVVLVFVLSISSLIIYFVDASRTGPPGIG